MGKFPGIGINEDGTYRRRLLRAAICFYDSGNSCFVVCNIRSIFYARNTWFIFKRHQKAIFRPGKRLYITFKVSQNTITLLSRSNIWYMPLAIFNLSTARRGRSSRRNHPETAHRRTNGRNTKNSPHE